MILDLESGRLQRRFLGTMVVLAIGCFYSIKDPSVGYRFEEGRLPDVHLVLLDLTIGKNTIVDVKKKLGSADAVRRREGDPIELCYDAPMEENRTRVIFEAGPLGGFKTLTGIRVIARASQNEAHCGASSLVSSSVSTEGGLALGMTRNQLIGLMGDPTQEQDGVLGFNFHAREPMTLAERRQLEEIHQLKIPADAESDVLSGVEVKLASGKVVEFFIYKIESY